MANEGIIDVFAAAGLKRPEISSLSDQFLAEVRGLKHKNVAAELLAKLLNDEIKLRSARNIVQSRQFSEMLKATLNAHHNRAIAMQEVIEELIKLARELNAATKRGVDPGLNDDEVAFYDALAANESAVQAMGNDELKVIAAELVTKVRKSVTIDWTLRESARARIRVMVKRILKTHGYPPDLRNKTTNTVLAQAELLSASWSPRLRTLAVGRRALRHSASGKRLALQGLAEDAVRGRRREDASIIVIDCAEPVRVGADQMNRISTAKRHLRREFAKAAHGRCDQGFGQRQPRPQSRLAVGFELIEEGSALGPGRLTLSQLSMKDLGRLNAANFAATHLALALGEGADAVAFGL